MSTNQEPERLAKLKRKERNRRYYLSKQQGSTTATTTEAGLIQCSQCETFQSPEEYRPLGEKSHIGLVSLDPSVCSNCHWYNDRYGIKLWWELKEKRRKAKNNKDYREKLKGETVLQNGHEMGGTGDYPGSSMTPQNPSKMGG